jgi:hypothetical protein
VENQRGGRLGDGDECSVLGRGRTRRTTRGVRKKSSTGGRRHHFNGKRWGGGPEGWMPRGGSGHEQGGPCRPASGARPTTAQNRRAHATCAVRALPTEQRGGERLTCGPRQQCRAALPLTSGAHRAAGEGERGGALTGGIDLSAGVDGGEAAACAWRAWAGPEREKVGRAQRNSNV